MEKASKAIALNLLAKGLDRAIIADATGLSELDIADLLQGADEQ